MVGPTVHPQLVDVLLKFRTHKVPLTADISEMSQDFPPAAAVAQESFYADDGITGADTIEEAIEFKQLEVVTKRFLLTL